MSLRRRTKIVATLGPASNSNEQIAALLQAGVDVFRLNFSHGTAEAHGQTVSTIRTAAQAQKREVAILADLQGPKIRIARFLDGQIHLQEDQLFILSLSHHPEQGNDQVVAVEYAELVHDVKPQDRLLLDDGRIELIVEEVRSDQVLTRVLIGGVLANNKGINKAGGGLSAPALTDKDKSDLKHIAPMDVDYVAISFVRHVGDVTEARRLLKKLGSKAGIVTKIERHEALSHLEELIEASDAVMVARGDLGVEIGDAELPAVQKKIIHTARALDRAVITATQMMESMISNSIPTRAEVFDVANAVLDGTDAVMLSAETATGHDPVAVVAAMSRVCLGAEKQRITKVSNHRIECEFQAIDEAIAMATMYTANHLRVAAIVALTESGSTPLWMSRIRSGIPIFALSRHARTLRKMALYRGVYPIPFDATQCPRTDINRQAVHELQRRGIVHSKDTVILTKGDFMGIHGGSNTMKIMHVGAIV